MQNQAHITNLLKRYIDDTATADEKLELMEWVQQYTDDDKWAVLLQGIGMEQEADPAYQPERWSAMIENILSHRPLVVQTPVHRIHFLRRAWFRYAAAIIIVAGIGAYLWNTTQKEKPSDTVQTTQPVPSKNDILPGGNRAILTLADGRKLILDSTTDGQIASQGNNIIIKSGGAISYQRSAGTREPALADERSETAQRAKGVPQELNVMSTPRGGQYQLRLPDGTKVWLNAESSITYPTAFTDNERKVSITGEAYFEVTKNKFKPFIVEAGDQEIEVLGTHFNVNAYSDEPTNKTTLLEGAVRIKAVHTSLVLKPGQQGQWNTTNKDLSLAVQPDVQQAVAWKNGIFDFNVADLQQVLRQLSRWYDVEVVYEDKPPTMQFYGKIQRNLTLQQVLNILEKSGVQFTIDGKQLKVKPIH